MQVSLLLGAAFVISSCDDVIGQEDNPVASYVQWQAKTPKEVTLKIGNTYTVEPGIYLPGWGGIRIEDSFMITPKGLHRFTNFPNELIELDLPKSKK